MKNIWSLCILFISISFFISCGSYETGGGINFDTDGDLITNSSDNCPDLYNPLQLDIDFDGVGDDCDDAIVPVVSGTFEVSGTVYDINGAPLSGAEVTISSDPITVTTDANGNFSATVDIGDGRHSVSVKYNSIEIYSEQFDAFSLDPIFLDDIETNVDPFINTKPVANAGPDQIDVTTGEEVTLDGSASGDVDGDNLTYAWSFQSTPAGSSSILSNQNLMSPKFTPDVAGTYVLNLVVNDGTLNSDADSVTITAVDPVISLVPPGNVTATPGAGSINISWDPVTGATSYNVYWSTSSGDGANGTLINVNGVSYNHEKLVYGQNYYYVVKALDDTGESDISVEASATPARKEISSLVFTDANLTSCVNTEASGLTYIDELTSLMCSGTRSVKMSSVDGIGWLTGLTFLYLGKNSLTDISELSSLINLEELWLITNDITDVSDLTGLTNILQLYLQSNSITTGVADLVTLINAATIDLTYNLDDSNNPTIPCSDVTALETALGTSVVVQGYVCQ